MSVVGSHLFKNVLNVCAEADGAACWNWHTADGHCKYLNAVCLVLTITLAG